MGSTGAPWNIPYVEATDNPRVYPAADLASATAVAAGLTTAQYVKQVVFASTSTQVANATSAYEDTGLTATITPTAATSRIMVMVTQPMFLESATIGEAEFGHQLLRGATVILSGATYEYSVAPDNRQYGLRVAITFVDAPATTGATVYKTQARRSNSGTLYAQVDSLTTSTITLIEIAA